MTRADALVAALTETWKRTSSREREMTLSLAADRQADRYRLRLAAQNLKR